MRIGSDDAAPRPIALTPLIDVVFILLIFFMLASSFLDWRAVDLKLSNRAAGAQGTGESLLVQVRPGGSLSLNGQARSVDQLIAEVKRRLEARPDLPVLLQPTAGVTLQRAVTVMDLLKRAGVRDLALTKVR